MMTLVTLDILRIFHPETKIRIDEHHASIDLPDLTRVIDYDLVNGVTVGQSHFLAAGNTGDTLHVLTVRKILAAAESAIGGAALPAGHTYSSLSTLCDHLNLAWHEMTSEGCGPSAWTPIYLSKAP
jgi:hypothetical protein